MKLTRRDLAGLAALSPLAAPLVGQMPAPENPRPDWTKAAREANKRNADALAKVAVPIATEPAFQFKP